MRIASVDAGEQRLGQIVERLLPKMIDHKFGDAAIGITLRAAQQLEAHANFGPPTQQV